MEKPRIKIGSTVLTIPHHQGYDDPVIEQMDTRESLDGTLSVDHSFIKYGVVLNYTSMYMEDYEAIRDAYQEARNSVIDIYFEYEKIPAFSTFKQVHMEIRDKRFVAGHGANNYLVSCNLVFRDVHPR